LNLFPSARAHDLSDSLVYPLPRKTEVSLIGAKDTPKEGLPYFITDWGGLIQSLSDISNTRYGIKFEAVEPVSPATLPTRYRIELYEPCFLIKASVNLRDTQLWWRGEGRVCQGTYYSGSSGTLITSPVGIIEDLCRSELGFTDSNFQSASITEAVSARYAWLHAMVLYGKRLFFRDIVSQVARESGLIVSESLEGQLRITTLDVPSGGGDRTIYNTELLLDGKKMPMVNISYTDISKLITGLLVKYCKNTANGEYGLTRYSADMLGLDAMFALADDLLDEDREATLNLDTIRDKATTDFLCSLLMNYHCQPIRTLKLTGTLSLHDIELGTWCSFDNDTYIKNTSGNVYLVVGTKLVAKVGKQHGSVALTLYEFSADGYDDSSIFEVPSGAPEIEEVDDDTNSYEEDV